ncbi:hypothetical protein QFZ97_008570 [Paraburkholderia youngii]
MMIAPIGPTKSHAGVMTTSPAIAPDTAPSIDVLPGSSMLSAQLVPVSCRL